MCYQRFMSPTCSSQSTDYFFSYPGCSGDLALELNLRRHFAVRHSADLVSTLRDCCPSKCDRWGLQVTLAQRMRGHEHTK